MYRGRCQRGNGLFSRQTKMNLTPEQIKLYNKEISLFFFHRLPEDEEPRYEEDWEMLMFVYEELNNRLPFRFCIIEKNVVYGTYKHSDVDIYGEIQFPLQQALFYVIGEICRAYNNKSIPISYEL